MLWLFEFEFLWLYLNDHQTYLVVIFRALKWNIEFLGGFGDFYTMKRSVPAPRQYGAVSASIAPLVQGYIDVLKDVEQLSDIQSQAEIVAAASDKLQRIKDILLQ